MSILSLLIIIACTLIPYYYMITAYNLSMTFDEREVNIYVCLFNASGLIKMQVKTRLRYNKPIVV